MQPEMKQGMPSTIFRCPLCGEHDAQIVESIRRKPDGETDFGIEPAAYLRRIHHCNHCLVYFNQHELVAEDFYRENYNSGTYQRDLNASYSRIRDLPTEQSDNKQRVQRVIQFHTESGGSAGSVLDVGSGLCVFLAEMKEYGYQCFAIDPDPVAVEHAKTVANVDDAHAGVLENYRADRQFDIITFNKVLEHVPDPVSLLKLAGSLLSGNGFIYVELPDGEHALQHGTAVDREEFYIEHETIFTPDSLQFLLQAASLKCVEWKTIHEPSDKYTLYAFARAAD
jgi:2-polyprenyl-3-methyl-5-hydroxy-6-metoxy-1,4-benzoquinol methylase